MRNKRELDNRGKRKIVIAVGSFEGMTRQSQMEV